MEELLREAACLGNLDGVQKLLDKGACVNSQHSINGWTALHWGCKRSHVAIVQCLLQNGADVNLLSTKGESVADVATSDTVLKLINPGLVQPATSPAQSTSGDQQPHTTGIIPNYLQNPAFPYYNVEKKLEKLPSVRVADRSRSLISDCSTYSRPGSELLTREISELHLGESENRVPLLNGSSSDCSLSRDAAHSTSGHSSLLVKVRVCGSGECDFVEVEVQPLTYPALMTACCEELEVSSSDIVKIRKLPNVLVRKDRDIQRMRDGQELEVVLKTGSDSNASPLENVSN